MAIGGGDWIRIGAVDAHLDANTMNKIITQVLQRKAQSITKDPELRQLVGTYYVNAVTDYVPKDSGKLQQSGRATSDGRVYWTATSPLRIAKDGHKYGGYNYALIQFEASGFRHPSRYAGHKPTDHWTDKMRPGTYAWAKFVARIAPEIIRRMNNGNS